MEGILSERCSDEIVIALHGPRSVGKSTLLAAFAKSRGVTVIDLDGIEMRDAVVRNPELAVGGPTPVCIDEYQRAPEILDALKSRLNREGGRTGLAVITGSTRHDTLPRTAQSLTGRLHVLEVLPFSQGELNGDAENFVEQLLADPTGVIAAHPQSTTTRAEYIERVVAGGLPLAVQRSGSSRARWFDDYIRQSIERDAIEISRVRDRQVLKAVLERAAAQTGQPLNVSRLGADLHSTQPTIEGYLRLLEDLYLLYRLPAWGTTLRARARKHPKLHMVDSGVAARLAGMTPARLERFDPSALTEFGHLIETFVVGEVRKQVSWMDAPVAMGHWRTDAGEEVDLVLEDDAGRVIGIEVKADERVEAAGLKGLRTLRDTLGNRFIGGVALTTGSRSYTYEERIHVCPVDRLWRSV